MTTTLYIYSTTTNVVVAIITGESIDCDSLAETEYSSDDYGWTETPAFGFNGGLTLGDNVRELRA